MRREERTSRGGRGWEGTDRRLRAHIDLVNKKCQWAEGCDHQATFGEEGERAAQFCAEHKQEKHINVRSRCLVSSCVRQRAYGNIGGSPLFCSAHRNASHINLVSKLCSHPDGCTKIPSFGLVLWGRGGGTESLPGDVGGEILFCAMHRHPNHVNLREMRWSNSSKSKHALCLYEGCCKVAIFGDARDRKARYCRAHKLEEQVNLKNKLCTARTGSNKSDHCTKRALFGNVTSGEKSSNRSPPLTSYLAS
eukprot:754910-Hanusia_phi.AAC.1